MYSILFAVGFIVLSWAILIFSATMVTRFLRNRKVPKFDIINPTIGWLAALACLIVIFVPGWVYEFPDLQTGDEATYSLAKQENGHLILSQDGYGFWEGEGCCLKLSKIGMLGTGTVTALTDNPKIRVTHYNLGIFISDPEKYYWAIRHDKGSDFYPEVTQRL